MRSAAVWTNPQCGQVHVDFGMSYRDLRAMTELSWIPQHRSLAKLDLKEGGLRLKHTLASRKAQVACGK